MTAIVCGAASGLLAAVAYRWRLAWLAALALAPLVAAVYLYPPVPAGLAAMVCGVLALGSNRQASVPAEVVRPARLVEAGLTVAMALAWGVVYGVAAWLWPDDVPAWGAIVMPAAAVALSLFYRTRAPRYWSWLLGSVDSTLPVVHVARLGTDLTIPALLGLSATVPVMLLVQLPPATTTFVAAAAAALLVAAALTFGAVSYRRTVARLDHQQRLRVAAVAACPETFDDNAPEYADIDAAIDRYQPHIDRAVAQGAQLIVLPEYAVKVSSQTRQRWLDAISRWARQAHARVVAGLGQTQPAKDQLVIADQTGQIAATYDKQHPAPGLEPKPDTRTPPALDPRAPFPVSAVVCVDLDYPDLVRPVSRTGGVLAVPANDWPEIVQMHHRSAVWSAVMAGVPVIRSTGHGISAVYDAAGRVLARANSLNGPVVLVTDVPTASRTIG
jgi:apolipoprotein N-acyltransferase